ncbi:(2Fe-2S) ferredoxin domain-containing protein [uncultured Ilyobacter sp.]|uniref:(2Fe-2S) ferredoxin domain-containing protein n=1 Tax=uncultured Ilyobacter sp. TaxID=544433 RepID=UPI0029F48F05|nr:(2Fe-2S) ferredoxin domain-containing protein [uncultured Ilyobacter sp.]
MFLNFVEVNNMVLKVCVGSACHIKGSEQVIQILQKCIKESNMEDQITLKASFCLGNCTKAVSVTVDDGEEVFSLSPQNTTEFFKNIMKKVI